MLCWIIHVYNQNLITAVIKSYKSAIYSIDLRIFFKRHCCCVAAALIVQVFTFDKLLQGFYSFQWVLKKLKTHFVKYWLKNKNIPIHFYNIQKRFINLRLKLFTFIFINSNNIRDIYTIVNMYTFLTMFM